MLMLRSFSHLFIGRDMVASVEDNSLYNFDIGLFELAILLMLSNRGGG